MTLTNAVSIKSSAPPKRQDHRTAQLGSATGLPVGSDRTKILVFTEGTIITHASAAGRAREEIVRQVQEGQVTVSDYASCIPVGRAPNKLQAWKRQDVEIAYLTSRTVPNQIEDIQKVLKRYNFPEGELFFRRAGEQYKDVAERVRPDLLIEDDCESIGGEMEMTYPHIEPELKVKIKSIVVREFGGIDHLPDKISDLTRY